MGHFVLMVHQPLSAARMRAAFTLLDQKLDAQVRLVVGGGAAMALAYEFPLATEDVDAFAAKGSLRIGDLDRHAKQVAQQLDAAPDWLNAHFESFTSVLPKDYASRLRQIYRGQHLQVDALGPEDLLIMKCFAGRDKDIPHARKLLRVASDLDRVSQHLAYLSERRYPGVDEAADFFDDLRDAEDV